MGPAALIQRLGAGPTCSRPFFDLLQFGQRGRRQDLQVHTFPRLEEVHHTVDSHLEDVVGRLKVPVILRKTMHNSIMYVSLAFVLQ